jgi:CheY-like chemotaxis protein
VTLIGGTIELVSRLTVGSVFSVRLPLPLPEEEFPQPVVPGHEPGRLPPCRMLLVEDDAIVASVIRGLLEAQGHRVTSVAHGLAALAELSTASFDLMLLDLDLPGVDGFQIARLVRQREPAGSHLPIVAITARSTAGDAARARAAGMDGFVRKPVSGAQLVRSIEETLAAVTARAGRPDQSTA